MKDFCLNKSNYKEKKVRKFQKEILVSSIFQKNNEKISLISDMALMCVITLHSIQEVVKSNKGNSLY